MRRDHGGNATAAKDCGDSRLRRPQSMLVDDIRGCGPCTVFRRTTEGETAMPGDGERTTSKPCAARLATSAGSVHQTDASIPASCCDRADASEAVPLPPELGPTNGTRWRTFTNNERRTMNYER